METKRKKVLVIGASGMVGMATVEALQNHVMADIVTYDRLLDGAGQERRKEREANFNTLKTHDLIDKRHAEWILRDLPQPDAREPSAPVVTHDMREALATGPDCIVIAMGVARKGGRSHDEKFSPLIPLNAPLFRTCAEKIVDAYVQNKPITVFPVIINTGNPADTMTELLVKCISSHLAFHVREAIAKEDMTTAALLAKVIKEIPQKVMGQGGVIDSSRAAFALHEVTGTPLDDIAEVQVLGPHNKCMLVNPDAIKLRGNKHLDTLTDVQIRAINDRIRDGGGIVSNDIKDKAGIEQTAVFGTAAAVTKMVDAVLGDKKVTMCASVYDPLMDRCMGRPVMLSKAGAKLAGKPVSNTVYNQLQTAVEALEIAFGAACKFCGFDNQTAISK